MSIDILLVFVVAQIFVVFVIVVEVRSKVVNKVVVVVQFDIHVFFVFETIIFEFFVIAELVKWNFRRIVKTIVGIVIIQVSAPRVVIFGVFAN